jgi:hypothetical protein
MTCLSVVKACIHGCGDAGVGADNAGCFYV